PSPREAAYSPRVVAGGGAMRGGSDRTFDLDRIRRNAAALRRRERAADRLRMMLPLAGLVLAGCAAVERLIDALPALQAIASAAPARGSATDLAPLGLPDDALLVAAGRAPFQVEPAPARDGRCGLSLAAATD